MHGDHSEKKRNGKRTKSDFVIHDFGMGFLGYIETIQQKNEMQYEQTLILCSMTLAWGSLDALKQLNKKKQNRIQQNVI